MSEEAVFMAYASLFNLNISGSRVGPSQRDS